ncbi:MAG: prepilin-type N-terminal cleavage/methylation domain-containing protein [Planctomycetota bacterium]|jgi:prepilin-type processing-associated H-X9-DG protein/prepilin-type N-terminal cleavage/methylation domain-containing protein
MKKFGTKATGFTLIELLVVIAIISLLVTILMPSLQKAKMLAKDTMCKANLSGIGKAAYYYLEENDGTFPVRQQWRDTSATPPTTTTMWYMDLAKSMEWPELWLKIPPDPAKQDEIYAEWDNPGIFLCPMTDRTVKGVGSGLSHPDMSIVPKSPRPAGAWWWEHLSYTWNRWMGEGTGTSPWSTKAGRVLMAAEKILIGDSDNNLKRDSWTWTMGPPDWTLGNRHNDRTNIVWCDGHVESGDPVDYHLSWYAIDPWTPSSAGDATELSRKHWWPGRNAP